MKKNLNLKERMHNAGSEERKAIRDGLPYKVGFGKPPESTQFKPGNTHGRRGRPKGSENLQTILAEEFDAKIEVNEGGKRRKLSKRRVGFRQLANRVASGETKATALYLDFLRKTGQFAPSEKTETRVLDDRDLETMDRVAAIFGADKPTDEDTQS